MRKYLLLLLSFILIATMLNGQTQSPTSGILYQNFEYSPEALRKLPKPLIRDVEFMRMRTYPNVGVPYGARQKAIQQSEAMIYNQKSPQYLTLAQQPQWRAIGPFAVGGRVKSVACHPTKNGWVYVGAAAGGIWLTTDSGLNWKPLFDYENAISMGSIAIDPNNPNILFAGTGEAVRGAGRWGGSPIYLGSGMYKSTDEGNTWNLIGLADAGCFSKVFVHPMNSDIVVAGAINRNEGFYKSIHAGLTWERTFEKGVSDLSINPSDPDEYMIAVDGEGVYFSSDGGMNWELRSSGFSGGIGRVSVQMAPSNPNVCYALMEIDGIGTIYKSTNKGLSWSVSYSGTQSFFSDNNQGYYDNYICINPTNENIVIAGGIDIYRTVNGGSSWDNMTYYYSGGSIHPDQHHCCFNPLNTSQIYAGNDGGMFRSDDGGYEWKEINNGLEVTQFYSMAIDNSVVNRNYGGTQDNGTVSNRTDKNWSIILGGDGFRCIVDPEDPNIVYGSLYYGDLRKIDYSKGTVKAITSGIPTSDVGIWCSPFVMDPNFNFALYHGRHALYFSYDAGASWDAMMSQKMYRFTAIASSPKNEAVIYAGNEVGEIYVTTDGGNLGDESFKEVSLNGLVNRYVTDIEPSLFDAATCYVTYASYGTPHVFKTTNYGESWENIGSGLPDVPVMAIALHPEKPEWLFVATDAGVFATFDDGKNWLPYGRGLPRSPVTDIAFHKNRVVLPNLVLRVATHGRSMWEIDVPSETVIEPEITSPAGGEILIGGYVSQMSWYGFDLPVKLEISLDEGVTWSEVKSEIWDNKIEANVPNQLTNFARVKVSSVNNPSQVKISNLFAIIKLQKGAVLKASAVAYNSYGLAWNGKRSLYSTAFYGNNFYKLNADNFKVEKKMNIEGDSLFTDLTIDRDKGIIYVHRMNAPGGTGGVILVLDTNGNKIRQMKSPSPVYPIGLELVDGKLIVGDRDGSQWITVINPETGSVIQRVQNPFRESGGPRGLCYDGSQYLYQASTKFSSSVGTLLGSFIVKIDKDDLSTEVDRMPVKDKDGSYINIRGIDLDPVDENFWVSTLEGDLYKIAGFDPKIIIDVEDNQNKSFSSIDARIYPNPLIDFSTVSFQLNDNDANVKVEILDVLGRNVGTFFDKRMEKQQSDFFNISGERLENGVYTVVFTINGKQTLNKKLVVAK